MDTNDTEFLEMKEQLKCLKKELDNKTRVDEQVLHKQIKKNAISLKKKEICNIYLVAVVTIALPPLLYLMHFSLLFCAATAAFFIFALCWEFVIIRKYHILDLMEGTLVQTAKHLRDYKRSNHFWLHRITPIFIVVWFTWYVCEYLGILGISEIKLIICTICCLVIGGVLGGIIGYFSFYKPQMQKADEILNYIQEIEQGE